MATKIAGRYVASTSEILNASTIYVNYLTGWIKESGPNVWGDHRTIDFNIVPALETSGLPRDLGLTATNTQVLVTNVTASSIPKLAFSTNAIGDINGGWDIASADTLGISYTTSSVEDVKHRWLYNGNILMVITENTQYKNSIYVGDLGIFLQKPYEPSLTFFHSLNLFRDLTTYERTSTLKYAYVNTDRKFVFATNSHKYTQNDRANVREWTLNSLSTLPPTIAYANSSNKILVRVRPYFINVSNSVRFGTNVYPIGTMYGVYTDIVGDDIGGQKFVITTSDGNIVLSTDNCATWTIVSSPLVGTSINTAVYGNGTFVVAGNDGVIATSVNGTTWVEQTSPFGTNHIVTGSYGHNMFVLAGERGQLATSPDGITWTLRNSKIPNEANRTISGIAYGNNMFVAIGNDGSTSFIIKSTNGINWTLLADYDTRYITDDADLPSAITFSEELGLFILGTKVGYVLFSYDGVNWIPFENKWIRTNTDINAVDANHIYSIAATSFDASHSFVMTTVGPLGYTGYTNGWDIVGEPSTGWFREQTPLSTIDQFVRQYAFADTGVDDSAYDSSFMWNWGTLDPLGGHQASPYIVDFLTDWDSSAKGLYHTAAIRNNGTLWTWGKNNVGQLGNGTTADNYTVTQMGKRFDWESTACGEHYTIAIRKNGSMWTWGDNQPLGILSSSPVQIGNDMVWAQAACGFNHGAAIKTDGTLWTWGDDSYGQLGDGTNDSPTISPIQVGSLTNWKQVSCGDAFTVAVKTDGTLWTWGDNYFGQLGDGTTTPKSSPIQVGSLTDWKQVSCGIGHVTAVKTDGTLWSWGDNSSGQLGDGTTTLKSSPIQIGSLTTWTQTSSGKTHSSGIRSNGTLWTWGNNTLYQMGDNSNISKSSPVQITASEMTGFAYWTKLGSFSMSNSMDAFGILTETG